MIIESGFEVFVQDVIAAITTEPCFKSYFLPSKVKDYDFFESAEVNPKPLNPCLFVKQFFFY